MKFKELPMLHKIGHILLWVGTFAMLAVLLCSIVGVLPALYENPLFITLSGIVCIGQVILNWKKQREIAILHLVNASICFGALFFWLVFVLIIH